MKRFNLPFKLLLLLGGLTPHLAPAQLPPSYGPLPTWGPSYVYDRGAHPRVSGGSPFINVVEIHQPATWSDQLCERPSGWERIDPTQPQFLYAYGYAPSMAAGQYYPPIPPLPLEPPYPYPYVVEVNQLNQTGPYYLWYNLMPYHNYLKGALSGGGFCGYGCHPTVAANDTTVVEVYQDILPCSSGLRSPLV